MKVLIVDDSPSILAVAKARLTKDDLEVLTAEDGRTGVEVARRARPDVILLDVDMPDIGGFEIWNISSTPSQVVKYDDTDVADLYGYGRQPIVTAGNKYLYMGIGSTGVRVYNIATESTPSSTATVALPITRKANDYAEAMFSFDELVFVAGQENLYLFKNLYNAPSR